MIWMEGSTPKFSVVIPAYNAGRTLTAALQSVYSQSERDLEIIIVDDGSRDNTLAVATSEAQTDSRIKVISGSNRGAAGARNAGIEAAVGKYVAFLDADDIWLPKKLEEQLKVFESDDEVRSVRCGACLVDDELTIISSRPCYDSKDVLLEILLFQNPSPWMSTLVVDRTVFSEIGVFDTSLEMIEDWEYAIRLARFGVMKSVEEPLALYRQHPGNRSKDWQAHIRSGFQILEKLFNDPALPKRIRKERSRIYSKFYLMICGAAFAASTASQSIKWGLKAVTTHPSAIGYILSLPLRRLKNTR
jgi:glycosyltransferase involved in cell wall biosynthesis